MNVWYKYKKVLVFLYIITFFTLKGESVSLLRDTEFEFFNPANKDALWGWRENYPTPPKYVSVVEENNRRFPKLVAPGGKNNHASIYQQIPYFEPRITYTFIVWAKGHGTLYLFVYRASDPSKHTKVSGPIDMAQN